MAETYGVSNSNLRLIGDQKRLRRHFVEFIVKYSVNDNFILPSFYSNFYAEKAITQNFCGEKVVYVSEIPCFSKFFLREMRH